MLIKRSIVFLTATSLIAQPVLADDDPNAATKAQTAAIEAETAKTNADAAKITAQTARDKAQIDSLGLPHFDNKTTLTDDGGAIEAAMLSTRAISAASLRIGTLVGKVCSDATNAAKLAPATASAPKVNGVAGSEPWIQLISGKSVARPTPSWRVVVLAGNEKIDLNSGKLMLAKIAYFNRKFAALLPPPAKSKASGPKLLFESATMIPAAISAVAGLLGSETTVSGVKLPEVDDHMLANAVAGQLKGCAILPSVGAGMVDLENDPISIAIGEVLNQRNQAAALVAASKTPKAYRIAELKATNADFDTFLKEIGTAGGDGQTPFVQASLADRMAAVPELMILRVVVNRSGGTITNTKNIGTYFGTDPVRVSGGLVASFVLVKAQSGEVVIGDTLACQTARVKLRDVQSGNWTSNGQTGGPGKAVCKMSTD